MRQFGLRIPKGTSKNYKCEFNRDTGWKILGELGFEPVRMVAIDADWSALRFRRAEFIKTMIRDAKYALSAEGKKRDQSKMILLITGSTGIAAATAKLAASSGASIFIVSLMKRVVKF